MSEQEEVFSFEATSPLTFDDFKKKSLYVLLNSIKNNYKANCNQFHNILRLFDVLPNFLFTTSETMGHHYLET